VDSDFDVCAKENNILSVGRFATEGHSKKQLEMLTAFREMKYARTSGYRYFSVGALGSSDADRRYFESARRLASGCGAFVLANVPRARLKELFQRSTIFWHAAGYGEDERLHPELAEHFGIATGEAMAAGCIPIVINKGSQPEIVQHGVNGFLWSTLKELNEYTEQVMKDQQLQTRMREAARIRARSFSKAEFVSRFSQMLTI
jgi:glycosyltransferase involved in cell wall biosynthesis